MPIAIPNAIPGAYVEECYSDDGKALPVRRRGWITKVTYPNDATYDSQSVKKVFAIFDREKGEEETKLRRLNLIRPADQAALERLKTDDRNRAGDDVKESLDIHRSPAKDKRVIVQDKTGLDPRQKMTPTQAASLRE